MHIAGFKHFESPHFERIYRKELWHMYATILDGQRCGDINSPTCLVCFTLPDTPTPLFAEIRAEPNARALVKFFTAKLIEARDRGSQFVFICIGEPPKRATHLEVVDAILASFQAYGGWVAENISGRDRLIEAMKKERGFFPQASFPKIPLHQHTRFPLRSQNFVTRLTA